MDQEINTIIVTPRNYKKEQEEESKKAELILNPS